MRTLVALLVVCLATPTLAEESTRKTPGILIAGVADRRKAKRKKWEQSRQTKSTKKTKPEKKGEPSEADLEAELERAPAEEPTMATEADLEKELEAPAAAPKSAVSPKESTEEDLEKEVSQEAAKETQPEAESPKGRSIRDYQKDKRRFSRWKLGLMGSADGALAGVPDAGGSSSGFGFGGGVLVTAIVHERVQLSLALGYQRIRLSRTVDATGVVNDTDPAQFAQTQQFLSGTLLAGFLLTPASQAGKGMNYWIDGGVEFLYGLSASQQSNIQNEVGYTADKMIFALLGPGGTIPLTGKLSITGGLYAFYHLTKGSGTSLYGGRMRLAMQLGL